MSKKIEFPCPCGGKLKWKKEKVVRQGVDCGILDIEVCEKCGDMYLPSASMRIVEQKLKAAGQKSCSAPLPGSRSEEFFAPKMALGWD